MIKYLILFIHLVGFSFYQLIFGDVSISQNLPNSFNAGEEVVVEVVIKKEGVGGFAKVQQKLPEGFLAEVVDAKGATFSFKDNIVKFIWMALPSENEFKITYKLKTLENIEGDFSLAGKFSFIDENERKNIEIPISAITILKVEEEHIEEIVVEEEPLVSEVAEEVIMEDSNVSEVVDEVETVPEVNEEEPIIKAAEEVVAVESQKVEINSTRSVKEIEDGSAFNVSVKISQSNLEGFAKIVEVVPSGFNAEVIDAKGGVFSFKNNEAKVLWMAAPTDKEFEIIYKLIPSEVTSNNHIINGSFSYLDNDVTQKHVINSSEFNYTQPVDSEPTTEVIEEMPTEVIDEEPIVETVEEVIVEKVNTNKITSTPSPETGISYKVQVGAGHGKVSSNYFSNKFNLNDVVATEAHDGWIKYLVGNFSDYKSARDKRDEIRNNVKRAFVTAYNQGSRITVQEALMISNQKWYK